MATRALGPGDIYYDGKAILLPPEIAHRISLRAAEIVRQNAPRGPNNSRRLIRATWQKGQIGVYFPPQAMHLLYLDRGIKPFVLKSLEGKTIPIRNPNGSISFRVAKNVGKSEIVARDEKGRILGTKIAWRHPGVEPMDFVQPAMEQALQEFFLSLQSPRVLQIMSDMGGPFAQFIRRLKRRV